MKVSDFDYRLPRELIAQSPVEPRDSSRLMIVSRADGSIAHRHFRDLGGYLRPGDVLVCNQSRVIPARIFGRKAGTGGRVEFLLISRQDECAWEALIKPGRRVRAGTRLAFGGSGLEGEVLGKTPSGTCLVRFSVPIEPLLDEIGMVPLPPYIHEPLADAERYQTIYARVRGSVAAPTAGLHFTPELVQRLVGMGVEFAFVTLHIGLDTFRPLEVEDVEDHRIHSEYCELSAETAGQLNRAKAEGRRLIAVGTTAVRVLETAALDPSALAPFSGRTDLFIYPGHSFRAVEALITNFHFPRSTLLLLVSAFAGRDLVFRAYREAIQGRYRFYSFGDAMLIL